MGLFRRGLIIDYLLEEILRFNQRLLWANLWMRTVPTLPCSKRFASLNPTPEANSAPSNAVPGDRYISWAQYSQPINRSKEQNNSSKASRSHELKRGTGLLFEGFMCLRFGVLISVNPMIPNSRICLFFLAHYQYHLLQNYTWIQR